MVYKNLIILILESIKKSKKDYIYIQWSLFSFWTSWNSSESYKSK
jgi:hypothetical protein